MRTDNDRGRRDAVSQLRAAAQGPGKRWPLLTVVTCKDVRSIGDIEGAVVSDVGPIGVAPLLRMPFDDACDAYAPCPSSPIRFFKFLAGVISLYVAVVPANFLVVQVSIRDWPRQ